MANTCTKIHYGKTKCIDSRKGSWLMSWFWCIVINCLVSAPCVFSLETTVKVRPTNPAIRYGMPLEIFCTDTNHSAEDLELFLWHPPRLNTTIVNSTTIRYYIKKPVKHLASYWCTNVKTKHSTSSRVLVDDPPPKVSDFKCMSIDLEMINCSWVVPKTIAVINQTLKFVIGRHVTQCSAPRLIDTYNRSCSWNLTTGYRQQEQEYNFKLVSENVFGTNEETFLIDHFAVVKPSKPVDLKVIVNGTHNVVLEWKIPINIADFLTCGIDHRIQYQIAKIDNTSYFRTVNTSGLEPTKENYTFNLTDLPYAYMKYEVRVYIKSKKAERDEFWSEFSYVIFRTVGEKPNRPPETVAGAFDQVGFSTHRVLYIYWKQLEEYEEAGPNFTYKVVMKHGNVQQTYEPIKVESMSYVKLERASLDSIDVKIWAINLNGSSESSSYLYIPPERDTRALVLTSFTKLAYENGTYELSWVGIDNIDNYTIFWCQYNSTNICNGRLNFTVVDAHKNRHVIDLPKDYKYQFAISANNGSKTSGMVWAKCDISSNNIAVTRIPVQLKNDAPGKRFIYLRWSLECALKDGIITGYNISYCPIIKTSSLCDKDVGNHSVYISDPTIMEKNITNLLPFRTYQFHIALDTPNGLRTVENTTAVASTLEDTPSSPRNILISDVMNDSLVISWDPPQYKNGVIVKYIISDYYEEIYTDVLDNGVELSRRNVTIKGLIPFTNHSLTVQACINAVRHCSEVDPNDKVIVRTAIGPPTEISQPVKSDKYLKWKPPLWPGGPKVSYYEIYKKNDDNNQYIIYNETDLASPFWECDGRQSGVTYKVRAVVEDRDLHHGVMALSDNVILPTRNENDPPNIYKGNWSSEYRYGCRTDKESTIIFVILAVFAIIGISFGSLKMFKKYKKMEDIKPKLPNGLGEKSEKDTSKIGYFGGLNPCTYDEKPSSDEMLLLPNSKTTVSSTDIKPKNENCGASDHTDSTALSDSSREPVERQVSTSDDGSNSSLNLDIGSDKTRDINHINNNDPSSSSSQSSPANSPYFSDPTLKKNPVSGYVQPVVSQIGSGYVQSASAPIKSPVLSPVHDPSNSSYVMAGMQPSIFTTGVTSPGINSNLPAMASGYVRAEDIQPKNVMNFPELGPSPTKALSPDSLPIMPTLPPLSMPPVDSSYIQLQSLDALPSLKLPIRNNVPLKPQTSSGYVSPGDPKLNKHLHILSGSAAEDPAILDPTVSKDAYCRFSWSTDPANDNLHSLLSDSSPINSNKN